MSETPQNNADIQEIDLSQKVISLDAFRKNNKPNSDINS
jgi:hypothetical protein